MYELLKSGTVALVKASWLVDFAESTKALLPRRQDMPREAFWVADDHFEVLREGTRELRRGHEVISISHCWLSGSHPDPDRTQLSMLCRYLKAWTNTQSGLLLKRVGVFFDWCSLMQQPYTREERALYLEGSRQVSVWYMSRLVRVWLLTITPSGVCPYHERGWPTFEAALASLSALWGGEVLDLGRCETGATHLERGWPETGIALSTLIDANREALDAVTFSTCVVPRQAPMTPKAFAKTMASKFLSVFSDRQLLIRQYAEAFAAFAGAVENLNFSGLEWGDEEMERVADALPSFTRLQELNLADNEITEIGAGHLAQEVAKCPSLSRLLLTGNMVQPGLEGSERLRETWIRSGKDAFWLLIAFPQHSENVRISAGLD